MRGTAGRLSPTVTGPVVLACLVVIVAGLRSAAPILAPVLFAVTLATLLAPLLRGLERRGLPTGLALLVMIVGLVALLGGILLVVYLSLVGLRERLPTYQALLAERLAPLDAALARLGLAPDGLPAEWRDGSALIGAALAAVSGLISSVVGIVFFLFTLCLLLVESSNLGRKFRAGVRPDSLVLAQLVAYTREIQRQYRIQAFSNLLSAGALTLEFLLFRIDFAFLWGILAFFLGFIPNIGLILACLPAVILAFILHGSGTALVVLALGIILNAAMDNLVTPRFMATSLQLPVLVSFLSFIFWSWVFGYLGALIAIPATLFVRALLAAGRDTRLAADLLSGGPPDETPLAVAEDAAPAVAHGEGS